MNISVSSKFTSILCALTRAERERSAGAPLRVAVEAERTRTYTCARGRGRAPRGRRAPAAPAAHGGAPARDRAHRMEIPKTHRLNTA